MSDKVPPGSNRIQTGGSKLSQMKAQFQQKQMAEKEAKLLAMMDNQQQRLIQHRNGVLNKYNNNASLPVAATPVPPGKVRQMFEERRKGGGTAKGIDKSNPLDPIVSQGGLKTATPTTRAIKPSSSPTPLVPPVSSYPSPSTPTPVPIPIQRPNNLGSSKKPLPPVNTTPTPTHSTPGTPNGRVPLNRTSASSSSRTSPSPTTHSVSSASASSPIHLPPAANTTKYSEYAMELERREASLSNKLKGIEISEHRSNASRASPSTPTTSRSTPSPKVLGSSNAKAAGAAASPSANKKSQPPRPKGSPPPGLSECKICGRFFAPDRIAKHESICKKVKSKKPRVFDPTKMRMQGTEAEPYIRIVSAKPKVPSKAQTGKKKVDWRKQHEEFIATIRAAKEYQAHVAKGGNPADLPPPPPSDNSDYVQCPHCGRKFSEGAADRHIPKCKNIKSNKR